MKSVGTLVLIGLVVWWLSKGQGTEAANLLPALKTGATFPSYPSEYELMHTTLPITSFTDKTIPVFTGIDGLG